MLGTRSSRSQSSSWVNERGAISPGERGRMPFGFSELGPSSPRRYFSSRWRFVSENGAACGTVYSGGTVKHDRQGSQSSQAEIVPPDQVPGLERQIGQPSQDGFKGDLALEPRQRSAEAKMRGPSERYVAVVLARDVQAVRIGETLRIAVGSAHYRNHRLALPDLSSAHFEICTGQPRGMLARALVAQEFFHRGRDQGRILSQLLQLVRIAEQAQHAVADQVCGRLLATHHGDDHVGDHLFFGQPGALDFGGHERVDQAVARAFALFADRGAEV